MDDADRIRAYWNDRALSDRSAQSTTLDFYLREIEFRCISDVISKCRPKRVFDVGCGDAYTTLRLAAMFPEAAFIGGDYAQAMVENAENNVRRQETRNVEIITFDVTNSRELPLFDFIYTTRCLINLSGWESQKRSLTNISKLLNQNGKYIMIENFVDGHREMNEIRRSFDLPEIAIRNHNCFFEQEHLSQFVKQWFEIENIQNISSTYYLVTRVIYAKICQQKGAEPDYFDEHHRLGARLPFSGNFGPVKMVTLRRK